MSIQSDAAKAHIEKLLNEAYSMKREREVFGSLADNYRKWYSEYRFAPPRRWAFDYAVPAILCANPSTSSILADISTTLGAK